MDASSRMSTIERASCSPLSMFRRLEQYIPGARHSLRLELLLDNFVLSGPELARPEVSALVRS